MSKDFSAVGPEADADSSHHNPEDVFATASLNIKTIPMGGVDFDPASEDSKKSSFDGISQFESQVPPPDYPNNSINANNNNVPFPSGSAGTDSPYSQVFSSFTFDETVSVEFLGLKENTGKKIFFYSIGALSLGSSLLLCYWFPKYKARMRYCRTTLLEATHILCSSSFGSHDIVKLQSYKDNVDLNFRLFDFISEEYKVLDFSYNRFIQNPKNGNFVAVQDIPRIPKEAQENAFRGLSTFTVDYQRCIFGKNELNIQQKSNLKLLVGEILHPFNVFQIFSILVWSFEDYYIYAAVIFIIAFVSTTISLLEMRSNFNRLRKFSHFECKVEVVRPGGIMELSSSDLVPGDTIVLSAGLTTMPCDAILLNGDVLADESMLTGESLPIRKRNILELHEKEVFGEEDSSEDMKELGLSPNPSFDISIFGKPEEADPRSLLYAGTCIIRTRHKHGRSPLALVLNTSLHTSKGNLIQTILFPRPNNFKFHQDSMRFIAMMGLIAFVSFLVSVVIMLKMGEELKVIIMKALDLITVVVPPALPATMSLATAFALSRLKSKSIYCISPPRIPVSSNIDCMCFDKTGTLTEEGLKLKGVINCSIQSRFDDESLITSNGQLCPDSMLLKLMSSCHSLQVVDEKVIGDPLDVEMFKFTGWTFSDHGEGIGGSIISSVFRSPGSGPFKANEFMSHSEQVEGKQHTELGVLKTFEFSSSLRRLSVVVKDLGNDTTYAFSKGSPEGIREICEKDSIPSNFDEVMNDYARKGYRLLACAGKVVLDIPWLRLSKIHRGCVESRLRFLGFLIFENPLKSNTFSSLDTLSRANINNLMCTGDNPLTALCVGRLCGITSTNSRVYLSSLKLSNDGPVAVLWEEIDEANSHSNTILNMNEIVYRLCGKEETFVITGDVFDHLIHSDITSPEEFKYLILKTKIFARMSPAQKQLLVEKLQSMGLTVGFCGDGANDCGALRASDVGISLSQAEASIAAPFTSRILDIGCVPELIKEGRDSLSTSFSCFKFMTLYSMIQYTGLTCLFLFKSYPTDMQFIYSDLFLIIPLGILLSRFPSSKRLSKHRPVSRLMSFSIIASILTHTVIQAAAQISLSFLSLLWRNSSTSGTGEQESPSSIQSSAIFLLHSFFYPAMALIFSFQHPFRRGFYLPFFLFCLISVAFACLLTFHLIPESVRNLFSLHSLMTKQSLQIICCFIVAFFSSLLFEFIIIPSLSSPFKTKKALSSQV